MVFWVNKWKNASIILPKYICKMWSWMRIKESSRERISRKSCSWIYKRLDWWISLKSLEPHRISTKVITSSLVDMHQNSCKESWGNQLALNMWPKHEIHVWKLILKHFYAQLGKSKNQTKPKKSTSVSYTHLTLPTKRIV